MFGLSKLFASIQTLTGNVDALSSTVAEINGGLRQRLRLDEVEEPTQAIGHNGSNGEEATNSRRKKVANG